MRRYSFPGSVVFMMAIGATGGAAAAPAPGGKFPPNPALPWNRLVRDLRAEGFEPAFIDSLRHAFRRDQTARILRGNVLSFLTPIDHHTQVTEEGVRRSREFCARYDGAVRAAEREYGVPGAAVCSLLYIETRHGRLTGKLSVPTVYATLYAARYLEVRAWMERFVRDAGRPAEELAEALRKTEERSLKKSQWAAEELRALSGMARAGMPWRRLRGSVSGAFGMPQFIPSSYLAYARRASGSGGANLFDARDAITSVARYLNLHGWGEAADGPKKALYAYNRSTDYGEAILEIAKRVAPAEAPPRAPAQDRGARSEETAALGPATSAKR